MSLPEPSFERVWPLIEAACLGTISDRQMQKLQDLLRGDAKLQRAYLEYCRMHAELRYLCRAQATNEAVLARIASEGRGTAGSPTIDVSVDLESQIPEPRTPNPEPPFPTLSTTNYPLSTTPFVGSWAFSYMVATVIMGVMLLGFWAIKITHHQHIAEAPSKSVPSRDRPELVFVGRITGMVDVKWSEDKDFLPPPGYAYVPLGRKYKLDSGLMQITYDSGAKVILEGPCTYEVESRAGGYLALGKLTARVESGEWRVESAKPQAANQKSEIRNQKSPSSFILHPSSLFSVRTPTATVTDLGTEFGVEVSNEGNTTSHVFRGSVRVQVTGNGLQKDVVLRENESARVEKGDGAGGPRLVLHGAVGNPPKFVRKLVEPPKVIDLLDIVAGGNGTGRQRERGIDTVTGMQDTMYLAEHRFADRKYHLAKYFNLIDGVFVPNGGPGPVQLDSAGHTFQGFGKSMLPGATWTISARAAEVIEPKGYTKSPIWYWAYTAQFGSEFMPERRGLLCMHSSAGITFDLEAIRKAHGDDRPFSRFHATAGKAGPTLAELWVFVDGRLAWRSTPISVQSGVSRVEVALQPSDRFLTLVSTEGGDGHRLDWAVFGDPVLDVSEELDSNQDTQQERRRSINDKL